MDLNAISEHKLINEAIRNVIYKKFTIDGYFDLSDFASNNINKGIILMKINSKELKDIINMKELNLLQKLNLIDEKGIFDLGLNDIEATFLVYLVLQEVGIKEKKINFIIKWLQKHTDEKKINCIGNIIYSQDRVKVNFIENTSDYLTKIYNIHEQKIYFRGHSNCNFKLIPSIMRERNLYKSEDIISREVLIECPQDFQNEKTILEKLVMMQHYGLPTRLLDITINPLVALYFACVNDLKNTGEIIVLKPNKIRYFDDDQVISLSCLSFFDNEEKENYWNYFKLIM